jgi:ppGpp synthetase/RelA/SpoT-type nucleotidyltranferase
MTFEEYQHGGRARYAALVEAVQNILRHALAQHEMVAHGVTGRAKDFKSLRKKLGERKIAPDEPMDEIKDLAGCRVVFLTNSQVDAFNNTGALHENFEVLNVNVHHPVPGTDTETKLFDSTNYLVQLKPDRLAMPEYRDFVGMHAEIQIQTLLNHAWAEMGHDTIYKEPKLATLGKRRMAEIGERMNKVMQDHLLPAGHDFDKIAGEFHRLVRADGAAAATIASIENADNNNELEDALETYADLVLPEFDEPGAEFSARLEALLAAVERARDYSIIPIPWGDGELPGQSAFDVARRVAQLIQSHRFYEPDRTVDALVRLYRGARDAEERRLWVETGGRLAEHSHAVWKLYGPAAQQVVLDALDKLDPEAMTATRPLLVAMLAHVLSADVSGATWSSDSVMFHQGTVPPSDVLRGLRSRSITWLERWLDAAADDSERLVILQALGKADSMPMQGGDNLIQMMLEDGARVASLILARAGQWGLELRRGREVDALHTHYRYSVLRQDLAEKPELVAAQEALIGALLGLRDQLAADPDYMLYKTLIGHDSVRPDAWDGDPFDYEATDQWRRDRFPGIIDDVTAKTVHEWKARIDRYTDAVGSDGGHLMAMRAFLQRLAEQKPEVGLLLAQDVSEQRSSFLSSLLSGLERAGRLDAVLALVDRWLAGGMFLDAIGDYLHHKPATDIARLEAYVAKAIEKSAEVAAVSAATIAAKWYHTAADPALIEHVLMPVVAYATEQQLPYWINGFHVHGRPQILRDLHDGQAEAFLVSFVEISKVDYRTVRLLVAIGQRHPQRVIDFFGTRLRRERRKDRDRFDPVPFEPHDLAEVLSPHANLLLPAVRRWYDEEPEFHEYRGGRLLKHAFPELTEAVSAQLIEIARRGDERDMKFILRSLMPYEGAEQLYPVAMEVVDRLEPGDKLLTRVSDMLGATGVLAGEFGFVQAYAERKALIERYLDDERPRVRAYARDRARELAQYMAWEQRRAARDVAQRRRQFGEE